MGNIENATKFFRLKSISGIEDNYLETATGGVLYFKKFRNIHRKTTVLESLFIKVAGRQACNFFLKKDSKFLVFL